MDVSQIISSPLTNFRQEFADAPGEKDFLNSRELYAPFKNIDIATLQDSNTGYTLKKPVVLPPATKRLLEKIRLSQVALAQ
tara:strand:- start:44 stop:286 length:243 start_codon:yes stop_codon:yes gene_type:complete